MPLTAEEKISWILQLVGSHNKSNSEADLELCDRDSDFEDIMSTTSSVENLLTSLSMNPSLLFHPYLSATDDYLSATTTMHTNVERTIFETLADNPNLDFHADSHISFIMDSLTAKLPSAYVGFDANHSWLIYWLTNSAAVTKACPELDHDIISLAVEKIKAGINNDGLGGIGGGANQLGHVASTYAGVLSLILAKEYELLSQIKCNLYTWLMSLKLKNGSFIMHECGESDTRSTYCALVIASLLGMMTPELTDNTLAWLDQCQTYEGGFAGISGTEAHGGYTFCAVASYYILLKDPSELQEKSKMNITSLIRWCASRQLCSEGGLSGRTNKLVDACYSFWIGAVYSLLTPLVSPHSSKLFDSEALRNYILRCAQSSSGGFRDKPGKRVDAYHTNYTLCGLSICEYDYRLDDTNSCLAYRLMPTPNEICKSRYTVPINPVFGLPHELVLEFRDKFDSQKQ